MLVLFYQLIQGQQTDEEEQADSAPTEGPDYAKLGLQPLYLNEDGEPVYANAVS